MEIDRSIVDSRRNVCKHYSKDRSYICLNEHNERLLIISESSLTPFY